MPKHPTPDSINNLKMITPVLGEMLLYVGQQAIEENAPGCIAYDAKQDLLTYHYTIKPIDRDLFDALKGTEEVWIEVAGGYDS